MSRIFVSGLINLETTLKIESFPLNYFPVCYPFHGIHDRISGVGFNVAKALHTLGDEVCFCSLLGRDHAGAASRSTPRRPACA
ncbi:MAG TPA: carbohydrate kinase family protein, partial [Candidatus Ozemobacteraceae bacterium]|nr:carbohydrate kinase family protein [Candidatus Ozemobacteraceae bacterium]